MTHSSIRSFTNLHANTQTARLLFDRTSHVRPPVSCSTARPRFDCTSHVRPHVPGSTALPMFDRTSHPQECTFGSAGPHTCRTTRMIGEPHVHSQNNCLFGEPHPIRRARTHIAGPLVPLSTQPVCPIAGPRVSLSTRPVCTIIGPRVPLIKINNKKKLSLLD